jgi:phosphatidylglycerol lysyltransferase
VLRYLEGLPPSRLLLSVVLTGAGYLALTGYDALAFLYLGRLGGPISYAKIAFASFTGYAFSNSLGMPLVTGMPVRFRLYSGWGLTATDIGRVVVFSLTTFWLGFLGLAGTTFLLEPFAIPRTLHLRIADARPLGALLLAVVLAYLALTAARRRPVSVRGFEVTLPRPPIALAQVGIAALDWALAGAVLFALLPGARPEGYPAFLGVFLFAQVAGLLSQVPAGLGVFETLMVLLLPPELPRAQVLAALVAFRGVYYFLPLLLAALSLGIHELASRRQQIGRAARFVGERAPDIVPQVLSVTTFAGGVVLLASGATPSVHARLAWLEDLLPLPLIEISHFLGSLAGVALLFLALGLQRRLDAAYRLTLALLAGGAVLSLLKGLDWEEATILALMLLALAPCRSHFYRKASLTSEPFTPGWTAAIAIVLCGSLWLGFFAYQHVDYSHDLWWRFSLFGNAPRFLRASVGALALAIAIALERLLRAAPPPPDLPTPEELDAAAAIAARSPVTSSWLALVGDKQLLFNPAGTGFVMFSVQHRSWVAMGDPAMVDPVNSERERADLAWRFLELCDQHGGWPVFYQVSDRNLPLYIDLGLTLSKLGEEARVPLADFTLAGSGRKRLRHAHRKVEEAGYRLEVVPPEAVPALLPELTAVSDDWLETKSTREKGFSLGRFDPAYLRRFPLALVRLEGRIVAFANLWPGGGLEELSVDLMRHTRDAPAGVMDYLFLELMLWGRDQGYRWFNLGMAPLSGLEARALAPLWSRVGALVYQHGEQLYNFQGLRQYKDKYDPVWEPRYLACPGGLALPRILGDVAALIAGGLRGVVAK